MVWSSLGQTAGRRGPNRTVLEAYEAHIIELAREYGELVWPLLYQCDVRCRSARLLTLRDLAMTEHQDKLDQGLTSNYDVDRQWNTAYQNLITHETSMQWWQREFHIKAVLVLTKTNSLDTYMDGDVKTSDMTPSGKRVLSQLRDECPP